MRFKSGTVLIVIWLLYSFISDRPTFSLPTGANAWTDTISTNSMPLIAGAIADASALVWPRIPSAKTIEKMAPAEKLEASRTYSIAIKLLSKVHLYDESISTLDLASVSKTVELTVEMTQRLYSIGGFVNLVLVDSLNRVALSQLSYHLIHHPQDYDAVDHLRDSLNVPDFDPHLFAAVKEEETGKAALVIGLEKWRAVEILMNGDEEDSDSMGKVIELINHAQSTILLSETYVPSLVYRWIETREVDSVLLTGLVEYLRGGGTLEDLKSIKQKDFNTLIGRNAFKSEITSGEIRLDVGTLRKFVFEFGESWRNHYFYKTALGPEEK